MRTWRPGLSREAAAGPKKPGATRAGPQHNKKKPPQPKAEGQGQAPMCMATLGMGGKMLSSEGKFPGSAFLGLAPLRAGPRQLHVGRKHASSIPNQPAPTAR